MSTVHVVVGGQYGSEAKGHVAAWLCKTDPRIKTAVRVAGPNAGHSAVDSEGVKWALRQIPVAAVVRPDLRLVLGQGSEIDLDVLEDEIGRLLLGDHQIADRLYIDRSATWLEPGHIEQEGGGDINARLGSTAKGVGAARAERIWRRARLWADVGHLICDETARLMRGWLENGTEDLLIEGTQGYALGLHGRHYPQCTSSDCTALDFMAMAAINPWDVAEVTPWVVLRTFPIRVAGNSGPLLNETSWEALNEESGGYIQPEKTTVTQKVRRVGRWDAWLAKEAVRANGRGTKVALMFFDYLYPELAGETRAEALTAQHMETISQLAADCGTDISLLGTGPNSIIDLQ